MTLVHHIPAVLDYTSQREERTESLIKGRMYIGMDLIRIPRH